MNVQEPLVLLSYQACAPNAPAKNQAGYAKPASLLPAGLLMGDSRLRLSGRAQLGLPPETFCNLVRFSFL
jgi:hypothetical protein